MTSDNGSVEGKWFGIMAHHPSRAIIHVSFSGENGSFTGEWELPKTSRGPVRTGKFTATRFDEWLIIRITTEPLLDAQFQLTILEGKGESMIFGAFPLADADIPFATVTLFRHEPPKAERIGICPVRELRSKRLKS